MFKLDDKIKYNSPNSIKASTNPITPKTKRKMKEIAEILKDFSVPNIVQDICPPSNCPTGIIFIEVINNPNHPTQIRSFDWVMDPKSVQMFDPPPVL